MRPYTLSHAWKKRRSFMNVCGVSEHHVRISWMCTVYIKLESIWSLCECDCVSLSVRESTAGIGITRRCPVAANTNSSLAAAAGAIRARREGCQISRSALASSLQPAFVPHSVGLIYRLKPSPQTDLHLLLAALCL